jgi:glutathione S-transferase
MTDLEIIGAPQSPYVWVTRIACAEKGVASTLNPAMPHSAEVSAIHPFGKIPVMRHGAVTLCESKAICSYIDRTFTGPSLVPADPVDAARSEQWVSILMTHVDPVFIRVYVGGYYFPGTADGTPDRAKIDPALAPIESQLQVFDRAVGRTGHLVGGSFSLADAYLVSFLFYANKLPETRAMLRRSTCLRDYLDRHIRRDSVQKTTPPAFDHEPIVSTAPRSSQAAVA